MRSKASARICISYQSFNLSIEVISSLHQVVLTHTDFQALATPSDHESIYSNRIQTKLLQTSCSFIHTASQKASWATAKRWRCRSSITDHTRTSTIPPLNTALTCLLSLTPSRSACSIIPSSPFRRRRCRSPWSIVCVPTRRNAMFGTVSVRTIGR